jgi:hypothetical protein
VRRGGAVGERARAEKALVPLLRRYRGLDPRLARERMTAGMLRRGFDYATTREAIEAAGREDRDPAADPAADEPPAPGGPPAARSDLESPSD